jgi:hypothetical protein
MDERQPSKKRRHAATLLYKDDMEEELNRTIRPKHGSGSYVQPTPLTTPFSEPAPIAAQSASPLVEVAIPVEGAPTAEPSFDGPSTSDQRGVYPEGYEHGERYVGRLPTCFNSSAVDDEEAATRAEWLVSEPAAGLEDGDVWGPIQPSPPQRSRQWPSSVLQCSREREPVLSCPRLDRGHYGEDGASPGRFNSRSCGVACASPRAAWPG